MAIEKFESGKWYKWTGPPKRRSGWNGDSNGLGPGYMDFILDGAPHKVNEGAGESASFFDSPGNCDRRWYWDDGFEYFQEVPAPSDSMPRRLTVGDRVIGEYGPGKIIIDDDSDVPYRVRFDDHRERWQLISDVNPEPPVKTSGEPIADQVKGCYHSATAFAYTSATTSVGISRLPETEIDDRLADRIFRRG